MHPITYCYTLCFSSLLFFCSVHGMIVPEKRTRIARKEKPFNPQESASSQQLQLLKQEKVQPRSYYKEKESHNWNPYVARYVVKGNTPILKEQFEQQNETHATTKILNAFTTFANFIKNIKTGFTTLKNFIMRIS
jgi:hypothetical protein